MGRPTQARGSAVRGAGIIGVTHIGAGGGDMEGRDRSEDARDRSGGANLWRVLEESISRRKARGDAEYRGSILAAQFVELGRSDAICTRRACLGMPYHPIPAQLPLERFALRFLANDVVRITYVGVVGVGDEVLCVNRRSAWMRGEGRGKRVFHQGTPSR
jgi:hypothetical protein